MKTYYDALFGSLEGTQTYHDFIVKNAVGSTLLECASGTGDLLSLLSKDLECDGFDLDETMRKSALFKYPKLESHYSVGDFLTYKSDKVYDNLVCVGDSLNYILTEADLVRFVDNSISLSNHIILDCHHPYRLREFADDYYEEGSTDSFDYAYQIEVNEEHLVHVINFLDGTFDSVYQWVFNPEILIKLYENRGYTVKVFTDFVEDGMLSEGEKVMLICSKEL